MDGADVCRTSSRASRRPPDVIAAVAILDSRWRRRKWHQPGLGVLFSIPSEVEVENGGPSASGRHLGWPHLQEPEMRSSKMATGSGRAAIFHLHLNGDRKKYPILLCNYLSLLATHAINYPCHDHMKTVLVKVVPVIVIYDVNWCTHLPCG